MLVGMLMVVAIVGEIVAARWEGEGRPKTRKDWAQTIVYWVFTSTVAFEMVAGGMWDLLRIESVRVGSAVPPRAIAWCVPVLIAGAMTAVAFLAVPSGPPPR